MLPASLRRLLATPLFATAPGSAMTGAAGRSLPAAAARAAGGGLGTKMAELAVAHVAIYVFPLIFAIVCARNLGPANYGVVSFYTALTAFLCMFIEFGFDSIGVREVHSAHRRDDPEPVLWNVTAAKLATCTLTAAIAIPVLLLTRKTSEAALAWAMLAYLFAFALDANWYLRSLELTRAVMVVAGVSRIAGVALLVAVVTEQAGMARAMWTYAFVVWANAIAGWYAIHRLGLLRHPRLDVPDLRSLFASGVAVVTGNLSGASLTSGGIAVLGVVADPLITGAANMALRIRTAGQAVLLPLSQMGFVRLSALAGTDRAAAVFLGRRLFYALMAISTAVSLLIIVEADRIAAFAYGLPEAPEVAGVLVRLVAVTMPAAVAGTLLCLQCLTLFKQERAYVCILLAASALFFALLLTPVGGTDVDYGWALIAAETWVVVSAGLYLRRMVRPA